MCTALEELENKGKQEGRLEGRLEGKQEGIIAGTIKTYRKFNITYKDTLQNIISEFSLSEENASEYMKKYW